MFAWRSLEAEFGRWRDAGKRPRLWWRDDDARTAAPALHRLIAQAVRADSPLCLAVIPEGADPSLCAVLAPHERIVVLQHGVRHSDDTGIPSEFEPDAAPERVAVRLVEGWSALAGFQRRLPVYVPPWNVLRPNVEKALALSGHQAVSTWGGFASAGRVDAHVDLLRWRGGPRFAGRGQVLGRLTEQLRRRRGLGLWHDPVGLLTHHLVHDEAAWGFLDELLLHPLLKDGADWPCASALFGLSDAAAAQSATRACA